MDKSSSSWLWQQQVMDESAISTALFVETSSTFTQAPFLSRQASALMITSVKAETGNDDFDDVTWSLAAMGRDPRWTLFASTRSLFKGQSGGDLYCLSRCSVLG
ncbi:hypothetical protein O9992_30085 [Vibrio lentus]|nr:hypothetical protein [Vibrio lentus]